MAFPSTGRNASFTPFQATGTSSRYSASAPSNPAAISQQTMPAVRACRGEPRAIAATANADSPIVASGRLSIVVLIVPNSHSTVPNWGGYHASSMSTHPMMASAVPTTATTTQAVVASGLAVPRPPELAAASRTSTWSLMLSLAPGGRTHVAVPRARSHVLGRAPGPASVGPTRWDSRHYLPGAISQPDSALHAFVGAFLHNCSRSTATRHRYPPQIPRRASGAPPPTPLGAWQVALRVPADWARAIPGRGAVTWFQCNR